MYACMRVHGHAYYSSCVEVRGQPQVPTLFQIESRSAYDILSGPWIFPESIMLHPISQKEHGPPRCVQEASHSFWGSELGSKHFTQGVISPGTFLSYQVVLCYLAPNVRVVNFPHTNFNKGAFIYASSHEVILKIFVGSQL